MFPCWDQLIKGGSILGTLSEWPSWIQFQVLFAQILCSLSKTRWLSEGFFDDPDSEPLKRPSVFSNKISLSSLNRLISFPTFQAFFRPVERSPSRTPRRVSAKTPPSTPTKMPPTTPAKTPPATPKKIRGPIVPLKEGAQRCHARIWAQGRGGQCLGSQRLQSWWWDVLSKRQLF